jgi:hypothetical protein
MAEHNGKFKAETLAFKLTASEFQVNCGNTGQLDPGELCTQRTAQIFALQLNTDGLKTLKIALAKALDDINQRLGSKGKKT